MNKEDNGTAYIFYSEGATKTRQNGLHQKKYLKNLSKWPVDVTNSGPFYL